MVNKDDDDHHYRGKKILEFKREGLQYLVEKETDELKKIKIKIETEICNKVVDVAAADESFPAREQQGYPSSTEAKSSTCFEAPVPLPNWGHHTPTPTTKKTTSFIETKNRMVANDNTVHEQRTKKRTITTVEEHQQQKVTKKRKKMESTPLLPPPPPQEMPIVMQQAITKLGGTTSRWLMVKKLFPTDINPQQSRLLFPSCGALEEFMTAEEKEKVLIKDKGDNKGLNVIVVDPRGEQWELDFRNWASVRKYVLTNSWNKMVDTLRMEPADKVQLWCFRLPVEKDLKLCFAMNIERKHTEGFRCKRGLQYWDEKEEQEKRRMSSIEAGKCSGIVDVATDSESSTAKSSPLQNWGHHPTQKRTKERQKMTMETSPPPPPPPRMQQSITELGGTRPVWLMEKKLIVTDTNPQEAILNFSPCNALEKFMTAEEKEKVVVKTKEDKGMNVMVVDTRGEKWEAVFKKLEILNKYMLTIKGNMIVDRLRMDSASDTAQLWCFRLPSERDSKLYFATNIEITPFAELLLFFTNS